MQQNIGPGSKPANSNANPLAALAWVNQDARLEELEPAELGYMVTIWSWFGRDAERVTLPATRLAALFPNDANRRRTVARLVAKGFLAAAPGKHFALGYLPNLPASVNLSVTRSATRAEPEIVDESPAQSVLLRSVICDPLPTGEGETAPAAPPPKVPKKPKPKRDERVQLLRRVFAEVGAQFELLELCQPSRADTEVLRKASRVSEQRGLSLEAALRLMASEGIARKLQRGGEPRYALADWQPVAAVSRPQYGSYIPPVLQQPLPTFAPQKSAVEQAREQKALRRAQRERIEAEFAAARQA